MLNEIKWKDFELGLLADVKSGRDIYAQERIEGHTPYVTAGTSNNGIGFFVGNDNDSKDCNVISVNRNGAVGEAFYHPYKALFGNDCRRVSLNQTQDSTIQLFIAEAISHQKNAFSYSRKLGTARLKKLRFMLPSTDNDEPDYDYMTQYTQSIHNRLLSQYKKVLKKRISEIEYKDIPLLSKKQWKNYFIPYVFTYVKRGKRYKKADHISGKTPYVSSTANNNGVDAFIASTPKTRVFRDCISLANSGSVGIAFYEPFEFIASDHVTSLKRKNCSKFIYLFLISTIKMQSNNFNFNREINDNRINKMQIMLPAKENGQPDFEYMEQYAKNMMLKKYKQYLSYLERKGMP